MLQAAVEKKQSAKPRQKKFDPQALFQSLHAPVPRVRVGAGYFLGLLITTLVMLVMPLIYAVMVALVCYGLYFHITHDFVVLSQLHEARAFLVLYILPIIAGVVLLLFMIKPIVTRKTQTSIPLDLRREDEPVLFEFIHRLCRALGAPTPSRIDVMLDVNASAGYRKGFISMLRRDLVLSIGLPLAAGMDIRQFAGVLAHELGHFSQGSAMRLHYIIRRINFWFARAVYGRDRWDYQLWAISRHADNYLTRAGATLIRTMVAFTRGILWCLMRVGMAVSAMMGRQMEFDADRYECRIAGSRGFAETVERLTCLSYSAHLATSDVAKAWRERRLCDDLLALIVSRDAQMSTDERQEILKASQKRKASWFDSHPTNAKRIASAAKENAKGVIQVEAPATVLFKDFAELSRIATMLHYKSVIGPEFKPQRLVKTEKLVQSNTQQRETFDAAQRYFRTLVDPTRPVFPGQAEVPRDLSRAAEQLLELRSKLLDRETDARRQAAAYTKARQRCTTIALVRSMRTAGSKRGLATDPRIDALSDAALTTEEKASQQQKEDALAHLGPAMQLAIERLELGLALDKKMKPAAPEPAPIDSSEDADEYELADARPTGSGDGVRDAMAALARTNILIESLRLDAGALHVLLMRMKPADNPKPLLEALWWHSKKAVSTLHDLHCDLGGVAYPYEHGAKSLSLRQYIAPALPKAEAVSAVASAANAAIEVWKSLYIRLMCDLCQRAVDLETSLGLPPLEEPVEMELE